MIDFKNTLIKLHERFPTYDLDTLIAIIDSIVETIDYNKFNYPYGVKYPPDFNVTCDTTLNCKPKIRNLDKEYTAEKFK
jgi:hypothetical protein